MLGEAPFVGFVPVVDLSAARVFYEGVLGPHVVEDTPIATVFDAGGTRLRLTPVPHLTAQPFTIAGWQVDDAAVVARTLLDRRVSLLRYDGMDQDDLGVWTTPSGDRVAWFQHPDGNTLSLTTVA